MLLRQTIIPVLWDYKSKYFEACMAEFLRPPSETMKDKLSWRSTQHRGMVREQLWSPALCSDKPIDIKAHITDLIILLYVSDFK